MLRWRLVTAAVILTVLVTLLVLDFHWPPAGVSGLWLAPVVLLAAWLAAGELLRLFTPRGFAPHAAATRGGTLLVVTAALVPYLWPLGGSPYPPDCPLGRLGWPLVGLTGGMLLVFAVEMRRFRQPGPATVHIALAMLTMAYVGVLLNFLVQLRMLIDHRWGLAALVSAIFIVKMSDTGAYAVGRLAGRTPMTPLLSPKKTVEGAAGGLVTACLSGVLFAVLAPALFGVSAADCGAWWRWAAYGLVVGVAGMFGDLAESLLKRDTAQKDSSHWVPGMGGVLDILDSLLVVAPAAYVCWVLRLIGPA